MIKKITHRRKKKTPGQEIWKRVAFGAIGATTFVMAVVMICVCVNTERRLSHDMIKETQRELEYISALLYDNLEDTEIAILNSGLPKEADDVEKIVERLADSNNDIIGCGIALEPEVAKAWKGRDLYFAYASKDEKGKIVLKNISDSINYNYVEKKWYKDAIASKKGLWDEPYFRKAYLPIGQGGKECLMCTFSRPIIAEDGTLKGLICADIALDEGIKRIKQSSHHDAEKLYLLSPEGNLLMGDTLRTSDRMHFETKFGISGWVLGLVLEKSEVMRPLKNAMLNVFVLYAVILLLVCACIYFTIRQLSKPAVQRSVRLDAELDVARRLQQGMLPKVEPQLFGSNLDVMATMKPAKEVGGDFYNFFSRDEYLYFVIADVSGKGVPAALYMAIATELFLVYAEQERDAAKIVEGINRVICHKNEELMFTTMIVGVLNTKTNELSLCNAGHNYPLLCHEGKEVQFFEMNTNTAVGISDNYNYSAVDISLPKGTKIVFYTDGVTEAENVKRELYGDNRLLQMVSNHNDATAGQLCESIEQDVKRFTKGMGQSDDITIMVVSCP